jgi:transcriptional regulator with XRE-family HTH domain
MGKSLRLENLKQIRQDMGKSQQGVADDLGIPLRSYQNWEQGRSLPRAGELIELANCLECRPESLFGKDDHGTNEEAEGSGGGLSDSIFPLNKQDKELLANFKPLPVTERALIIKLTAALRSHSS